MPSGRLLILGEPGAGKTILAVRLVLDLLARRAPGGPVPVLVPLASWNPQREHLWSWLERRLCLDHSALRAHAPGARGTSWARALWDAGLFLPVLDGLDEITGPTRSLAIAGLNEALRPGVGLVVTLAGARTGRRWAPTTTGPAAYLSGAAGIRLRPLDAGVVAHYLRAAAGGPARRALWGPVLASLADPAHPLGQTLTTPLMA
ncbi:NACHT domain-containing protein [Streptomyces stramineus]